MSFPASDVRSLEPAADGEGPDRLTVNFFGVATPASWGSLPTCYAELVRERLRDRDPALRDFLDLFNHRLLSLFYRAWEKHRFEIEWERSDPLDGGLFERALLSTLGMRTDGLRGRLPFPDLALLRWSGVLLRRPTTAHGLVDVVRGYFGVPVTVEQFVPGWYRLDDEERLRLGGDAQELGRDTFLGRSVRIAQFKFRLRLGPLDRETYRSQLPGGEGFRELKEMVRFAAGPEFDFEIQLVLRGDEVPPLVLGGDPAGAVRLGWDTWLASGPLARDPDDVVVSSGAHAPDTGAPPPHRH
jgi:type VI secretion system protein ImpH